MNLISSPEQILYLWDKSSKPPQKKRTCIHMVKEEQYRDDYSDIQKVDTIFCCWQFDYLKNQYLNLRKGKNVYICLYSKLDWLTSE